MSSPTSRHAALDAFKVLLAFVGIAGHARFLSEVDYTLYYLTSSGAFRVLVPMFLLISGYYMAPLLTQGPAVARTWLRRVAVMYGAWMVIYAPIWIMARDGGWDTPLNLVIKVLTGHHHLWYMAGLLVAGALVFALIQQGLRFLMVLAVVLFGVGVALQHLGNYHVFAPHAIDGWLNQHWTHRNAFFLSFPMLLMGIALRQRPWLTNWSLTRLWSAALLGVALLIGESAWHMVQPGHEGVIDNFIAMWVACPLLFLALQRTPLNGPGKTWSIWASAIFFGHSLMLSLLRVWTDLAPTPLTLATAVASVILAAGLVHLHRRWSWLL
jgi:surface polysaccharide O-acyltransferase-like enzyme